MGLFSRSKSPSRTASRSEKERRQTLPELPPLSPSSSAPGRSHSTKGGAMGPTEAPQLPPLRPGSTIAMGLEAPSHARSSFNNSTPPRQQQQQQLPQTPPRHQQYQHQSVGVGEIFRSPNSFYTTSPPASAGRAGPSGGWEAGGGNEVWRDVLGGAVRPPSLQQARRVSSEGSGWAHSAESSSSGRREGSLPPGAAMSLHGGHRPSLPPPPKDEFVSPPPRRSSLAQRPQGELSTPRHSVSLGSPLSTPSRAPHATTTALTSLQAPTVAPTTLDAATSLPALYGSSPTPSHSSTFAPSSESRLSLTVPVPGGRSAASERGGERADTPPSESEEERAESKASTAEESMVTPLSLDEPDPPPVVVQASHNVQQSVGRPPVDPQPQSPQRQRTAYDYKPPRALAESRRSMEQLSISSESAREPQAASEPVSEQHDRPSTPPAMVIAASPPTTSPSQSAPIGSTPRAASSAASYSTSPPSTPSRRPAAKETTPRAAALAKARERSELGTPEAVPSAIEPPASVNTITRPARELPPSTRLEQALINFPSSILKRVLEHLDWGDVCALRGTSRSLKRGLEEDSRPRELVLQRFLGAMGYRTLVGASTHDTQLTRQSTAPRTKSTSAPRTGLKPIVLTLRDLDAFLVGLQITAEQYATFSVDFLARRLHPNTLRLVRASTRAWCRVVLRIRSQTLLPPSAIRPLVFASLAEPQQKIFKAGRAPLLKVWVPTKRGGSWMDDSEVVECEREVWRSGVWSEMKRGDVVANMAISAVGNVGRLIHDGKYLRDFSFEFDSVGHLPPWLNALTFSPGYYHNIVASSTSSPVIYLALQALAAQVQQTLVLCDDKAQISSPQGNRLVRRFVYRAAAQIRAGEPVVEGGTEAAHTEWAGTIIFEADGTTEHARLLTTRTASVEPTPYRVLREKSRPGRLWLKPVTQ